MEAILVINMGAPSSEAQMRVFLRRMFRDRQILPLPSFSRFLISELISRTRYRKSWQKYVLIGGSPLKETCERLVEGLQTSFGPGSEVALAYSYSEPSIISTIDDIISRGIRYITIMTMYPQASFSTTGSVANEIKKAQEKYPGCIFNLLPEYYSHPLFISFWEDRIRETILSSEMISPTLIFSAHSVPRSQIRKGDTYENAVYESARLIANQVNLEHIVGFQSRVGTMEWVGPDVSVQIQGLIDDDKSEFVIIPISFLTENLETLYDIDMELIQRFSRPSINIRKASLANCDEQLREMMCGVISASN